MRSCLVLRSSRRKLLLLTSQKGVNRSRELLASLEEFKLEQEDESKELSAHLLDEFTTSPRRSTYSVSIACLEQETR